MSFFVSLWHFKGWRLKSQSGSYANCRQFQGNRKESNTVHPAITLPPRLDNTSMHAVLVGPRVQSWHSANEGSRSNGWRQGRDTTLCFDSLSVTDARMGNDRFSFNRSQFIPWQSCWLLYRNSLLASLVVIWMDRRPSTTTVWFLRAKSQTNQRPSYYS